MQDRYSTIPNLDDFNAVFSDIARFNQQFSLGSMIAGLIIGHFEREPQDTGSPLSKYGEQAQRLTAGGIYLIHFQTLEKVGLVLESVSGKTSKLIGQGEMVGTGELRLNVSDSNRFLGFLRAVNPQMTQSSPLGGNLQSLSRILARQIIDHYDLRAPSDEALQLLGALEGIVNEYRRLNIPGIERLEDYLVHARKGDLREYLLVEQKRLLTEPGQYFGPADWQRDASPESLQRDWGEALKVLEIVQTNPKARDLFEQLETHLRRCLDIAIQYLEELEGMDIEKYQSGLRPVLQEVKQAFSALL